jgi:hypothetical protein
LLPSSEPNAERRSYIHNTLVNTRWLDRERKFVHGKIWVLAIGGVIAIGAILTMLVEH